MPSVPSPLSSRVGPTVVAWAERHLRDLPWRRSRDPWAILVAETMLQQTQVARVEARWARFLERFPDPATTAAAPPAAVVRDWEGLGYNRRALMLHRAAVVVTEAHGGVVPSGLAELLELPGVGPYTARAVRAFAFEEPAAPVDTNIGRVLARLVGESLTPARAQAIADAAVPPDRVWLYNQGVMEVGALVCTRRRPGCAGCPLRTECAWRGNGEDPATGSAGVGRPQAPFAGSDRELRGRLVDALRRAPVAIVDAPVAMGCGDAARAARVRAGLVRDGLVEVDDASGELRLVGDEVSRGR